MNLDSFAQTLGDRLRTYRERAGLTQSDVADMLNITAQAYSHYETGRRATSNDNFYRIAQLYHTSMENLLTGEQDSSLQLVQQISDLPQEDQEDVEQFIRFLQARHLY